MRSSVLAGSIPGGLVAGGIAIACVVFTAFEFRRFFEGHFIQNDQDVRDVVTTGRCIREG